MPVSNLEAEHGVLADSGRVRMANTPLRRAEPGYVHSGVDILALANASDGPARIVLLGGAPFDEEPRRNPPRERPAGGGR